MAESDASSEMSDKALHSLVSRLVGADPVSDEGIIESDTVRVHQELPLPARNSGASENERDDSTEETNGDRLPMRASEEKLWCSSSPVPASHSSPSLSSHPSPQGSPSHRTDGLSDEADLLASSSPEREGGSTSDQDHEDPVHVVVDVSTEKDAVVDSDGYEGDVGDTMKLSSDVRPLPRVPAMVKGEIGKDGAEEADDEGNGRSGKLPKTPVYAKQLANLEQKLKLVQSGSSVGLDMYVGAGGEVTADRWEAINESLQEQGFGSVLMSTTAGGAVVPQMPGLVDSLRDVLYEHERRGKVIQDMALELNKYSQVTGHREQSEVDSLRRQVSDLSRRTSGATAKVSELRGDKIALQEQLSREKRHLLNENKNLVYQLKQSEHRVKAKEAAAQRLMEKLRLEVEKEKASQAREREALKKLQLKEGRGGGNDARVTEVVGACSRANDRLEAEVNSLRSQVAWMGDELREKENTILRYRSGPDWCPQEDGQPPFEGQASAEIRQHLTEAERSLRVMRLRESKAKEKRAEMEQELEEARSRGKEMQESLLNLQLELESRPTLRSWRASQKRIEELEAQLSQTKTEAREAANVGELRRWVDTRELIRQDRENHRLKLDRLDGLPTAVMKQVLQETCRTLSLTDVSLVGPSVAKLTQVVQVLPRLERFVNRVCSFVFKHSAQVMKASGDSEMLRMLEEDNKTMEGVIPLLEQWLECAKQPAALKEFYTGVLRALETRAVHSAAQDGVGSIPANNKAALAAVEGLVELEQRVLRERNLATQADESIRVSNSHPDHCILIILKGSIEGHGCVPILCVALLNTSARDPNPLISLQISAYSLNSTSPYLRSSCLTLHNISHPLHKLHHCCMQHNALMMYDTRTQDINNFLGKINLLPSNTFNRV
ncbi:unnamed protein product [Discosporangium mesarthrocarpum]